MVAKNPGSLKSCDLPKMRAYIPRKSFYCVKVTFLHFAFEHVLIFFLELHFLEYQEKSGAKLRAVELFHFFFSGGGGGGGCGDETLKGAELYSKIKE